MSHPTSSSDESSKSLADPDVSAARVDWIDLIKGLALSWIVLNHISESIWGHPLIANPGREWPALSERWSQLMPMTGAGLSGVAANALRYVGWFGDQAVGWFILLSGFTLSYGQLRRHRDDSGTKWTALRAFYRRRLRRIFPIWWTSHLVILLPIALLGWKISIADPRFFLSLMGIRITPAQMYFGVPAWWFIGLLLQLYLVFPFLHMLLRKFGPNVGVIFLVCGSLVIRACAMEYSVEWIDAWSRGSIFVSRLSEFAVGMWLAFVLWQSPARVQEWLDSRRLMTTALFLFLAGNAASMSFQGMFFAPLLMTLGGVGLACSLIHSAPWTWVAPFIEPVFHWIGRHSLSLFLVHHPVIWVLLRHEETPLLTVRVAMRIFLGLAASVLVAMFVEWVSRVLTAAFLRGRSRWGVAGLLARCGAAVALMVLILLPFELAIRSYAPQDVTDFGWSERPSLIRDPQLGFRLRPSSVTRLRWESYDYTVTANASGFPGPELPITKPSGTFRIMTVGDAFTSAEGVDTDQAWPRRLESKLKEKIASTQDAPESPQAIDVVNFGITGFGPNQYATLVEQHASKILPDLIIIGFFTNDYVDVHSSAMDFQEMVGFDRPRSDTVLAWLTGRHVFRYLRGNIAEAIVERLTGEPCSHTRFFCQCDLFDRDRSESVLVGRDLVHQRFTAIKNVADQIGADVCVMSIPAPIQVAPLDQLEYIRPCLNLKDDERYDYDHPQRLTQELTEEFQFEHVDLRRSLQAAAVRKPYQSHNLHFTKAGHDIVSDAMVPVVLARFGAADSGSE